MPPAIPATLQVGGNPRPRPSRTITISEYSVKAYYFPRYSPSSPSLNGPHQLIDAAVKLKASEWSIDLHQAFSKGTSTDSYFVGGPPQNWPAPPCFCGQMFKSLNETQENGEWDEYWDCTAICKLRRRYQTYMKEQEKQYEEDLEGKTVQYILFVEGGDDADQDDIPLLDREPKLELDLPILERAMVMVRVEGWIPVDVKSVTVNGQVVCDAGEDEIVCLKKFLKGMCNDESSLERRFHQGAKVGRISIEVQGDPQSLAP